MESKNDNQNEPLLPLTDVELSGGKSSFSEEPEHPPAWKSRCWHWGGLTSEDKRVRDRAKLIWSLCALFNIVFFVLLFLVIIPAIIQSLVDQSDLTLVKTEISGITNTSFVSTTVTQFSNVNGPGDVTFKLKSVNVEWDLGGGTMAKLVKSNTLPVKNNKETTMIAPAKVVDSDAFANFNTYLMHHESGTWTLDGTAEVNCFVSATVNIKKDLTFVGFNDFPIPPIVYETNLTDGTPEALFSQARVSLTSSSNVQLTLNQPLYFHFEYNGEILGIGHIPDYIMTPGSMTLDSFITFSHKTDAQHRALMRLLSYYACGIDVEVKLKKFFLSPPVTWLAPALDSIDMTTTLPASKSPMIQKITIYNKITVTKLPFTLTLYNPQAIPVTLTSLKGNVTFENTLIADVNIPNLSPPIVIPPYSVVTSQQLPSISYVNKASMKLLSDKKGLGYSQNFIGGTFGSFPANFYYRQFDVPLFVV